MISQGDTPFFNFNVLRVSLIDKFFTNFPNKQLKNYCKENNINVLSSHRKVDLVKLVKEYNKLKIGKKLEIESLNS